MLLGLDGATFDLLLPWIKQGKLPHMEKLLKDGVNAELESTIPCTTPVAWSTVFTGKNPGKHGIFDFRESFHRNPGRPLISLNSIRATRLWKMLNATGKKAILLNVPLTFPPEPLDGIMVSGMMTPSEKSKFTYPSEIKGELLARFPDYTVDIDIPKYDTQFLKDGLEFLGDVEKSFKARKDAFFYFLNEKPWDFLFAVFILSDRIQHLFWKYIDPKDNEFRQTEHGQQLHNRILALYQMQDEMIGEIASTLQEYDSLFIISDHGFGGTEAYINVNTLLEKWGYLKLKPKAFGKRVFFKIWEIGESNFAKKLIPDSIQRQVRSRIRKTRSSFKSDLEELIDYDNTKAIFASIPCQGIYINATLSDGTSMPAEEYGRLRDELKHKLLELIDDKTGEKIMDAVYYREELYSGPYVKWAPDIVFIARNYAYLGRQHIGAPSSISDYRAFPNGFHRPQGIFIACGNGIKTNVRLERFHLQDIAPTILYSLGNPIPSDMDGRVLEDIYTSEYLSDHPILSTDESDSHSESEIVYSQNEAEEIQRRLRSLGYIE